MLKKPQSMDECVYFTNRTASDGRIMAWVFRKECPKCRGIMGKPKKPTKDKVLLSIKNPTEFLAKGGKVEKKADTYVCYSCGYSESNQVVEDSLTVNVEYKCPHCGNEGEATTEYKRKSFEGVPSYVFMCSKCKKKIGITKKLKESKKKKKSGDDEDAGDE
jgi:hypothetical protein